LNGGRTIGEVIPEGPFCAEAAVIAKKTGKTITAAKTPCLELGLIANRTLFIRNIQFSCTRPALAI
jgi:hypothetical protein